MNNSVLFWGTPEFALPSLENIYQGGLDLVGVVTNQDELVGRKQILTAPPVKQWAQKHKIPVYQPATLKDLKISDLPKADLYVVAAYGKIIPPAILAKPTYGVLNVHPSLLPRWRGPSPIQYTILAGDTETGVTIMKMDELMDHGQIVAQKKIKIGQTAYPELHDRLAKLGAELLAETLPKYLAGQIKLTAQDDSKATFSKLLRRDDGRIDWKKPAAEIDRMIRAFNPWPGTWTLAPSKDKIYRIKIEAGTAVETDASAGLPGYVWSEDKEKLLVKTGRGNLSILKLTLAGKKPLTAAAFISGYAELVGSNFI